MMPNRIVRRDCCLWLLASVAVATAGCRNGVSAQLIGPWVGRPDNAESRQQREAGKYGEELDASESSDLEVGSDRADLGSKGPKRRSTDWEQYDVSVLAEFRADRTVTLSLAEGRQPIVARWTIVESGPAGVVMELATPTVPSATGEDADANANAIVRRRFELQLDMRDGLLVGFSMAEVGADPLLGSVYFARPTTD